MIEDDEELKQWQYIYPDAHRNAAGKIVSPSKWDFLFEREKPPDPVPEKHTPKTPSVLRRGGYINPPIHRPPRGKGEKGRISNGQRLEDAQWNLEIPGAQLTLHPIRKGKEGWDIRNLVMGNDITYEWGCGCSVYINCEGDPMYQLCGKDPSDCQRPQED